MVSVGALTLLIGCIIGAAKDDIKRVLAWSTVSQIGYMFLGVGLGGGAYALAIIHLLAHGFFKANMFLGAGSVMHGMKDQVDIRRFGGLSQVHADHLAHLHDGLAGDHRHPAAAPASSPRSRSSSPPSSADGWTAWLFGGAALLGAGLTAFYMTRLFVLTFHGPKRWTEDIEHPHESPPIMTIPLILLAIGSVVAGCLMATSVAGLAGAAAAAPEAEEHARRCMSHGADHRAVAGAHRARRRPGLRRCSATAPPCSEQPAGAVVTAARRNLYTDAFNEAVFEKPGIFLTRALVYLDNRGIDGAGQRPRGRRSAAAPAGCAGCRPASSARTPCPCSPARCSWSARSSPCRWDGWP